jgi:hypothetical protein
LKSSPYFVTDPRDGSLYVFNGHDEGLKKFPYTVAELVATSPLKSADGFLFTGDKHDEWLRIDCRTGIKLDTIKSDNQLDSSEVTSDVEISDEHIAFIGRTKYTISMFASNNRKKLFNLTYYDYSTHSTNSRVNTRPKAQPIKSDGTENESGSNQPPLYYPYYHFSSSSDGSLVTLNKKNGSLKWDLKLSSPIVGMYRYENDQLLRIDFSIYAAEALESTDSPGSGHDLFKYKLLYQEQRYQEEEMIKYLQESTTSSSSARPQQSNNGQTTAASFNQNIPSQLFVSTLYIGFYKNALYALPAYAYNWQNAIEGPKFDNDDNTSIDNSNSPIIKPDDNDKKPVLDNEPSNNETFNSSLMLVLQADDQNETVISNKSLLIGHHRVPTELTFHDESKYLKPSEIFGNNKNDKFCLPDDPKAKGNKQSKKGYLLDKLDSIMQNRYIWSLLTIIIASVFPISKTIYDCQKKVT